MVILRASAERVLRRFFMAQIAMSPEMERNIDIVTGFLKGSRRAKFLASIEVLRTSVAQGNWISRGAVKAQSGFYQGLVAKIPQSFSKPDKAFDAEFSLKYGKPYHGTLTLDYVPAPAPVQRAWFALCNEFAEVAAELQKARPKPVLTQVGLSPKVTKTLFETGLDIDLSTVRIPPTEKVGEEPVLDEHGEPKMYGGRPVMRDIYEIIWPAGTEFDVSRFSVYDGSCEACGKRVPSERFVPIAVHCRKIGPIALWVGRDCAGNIFGVKDMGFRPEELVNGPKV